MEIKLWKDERHHHFWIEGGMLYETYSTIRGLRFRERLFVELPDTNKCSDEQIKEIESTLPEVKKIDFSDSDVQKRIKDVNNKQQQFLDRKKVD